MEKKKLVEVLRLHALWIESEEKGVRANLSGTDLSGADLSGADLSGTDLSGTDLKSADLRRANLGWANLSGADLSWASLKSANLSGTDLSGADLSGADLSGADLSGTDLGWANLKSANLSGADLDFSSFPLWCGGSRFTCDARLVRQLFAHIVTLAVVDADDDLKTAIEAIRPEAKKSHRAEDLGLIDFE